MTLAAIMRRPRRDALVLAVAGGGEKQPAAAATPAGVGRSRWRSRSKPAHHSGVSGTARLVPGPKDEVTLTLDKHGQDSLPADIHTGPCSDEPTFKNPRIWASLDRTSTTAGRRRPSTS